MKTPELNLETDKSVSEQKQIITYSPDSNIDYQSLEVGTIVQYRLANDLDILLETHPNAWIPSSLFSLTMCELIVADDCTGKVVMDFAGGLENWINLKALLHRFQPPCFCIQGSRSSLQSQVILEF
ncbi:MAG: hypothetical protein SWX82_30955 [Cyanobacteriota bacterium]|nr:hypothetical protein [Cyanobacteriota bacterium]